MTGNKPAIGSNLATLDAYEITPAEYEGAPEWTDADFARAEVRIGTKLIRRGRPPSTDRKRQVTLRLDPDVIEAFRATGTGWQSRINETLKAHLPKAE